MSAIIPDTSVLIDYFKGEQILELDQALIDGRVYLPVIVVSELLSGNISSKHKKILLNFFQELPLVGLDLEHWVAVGELRNQLRGKGTSISTPDAHIAYSALSMNALLMSKDNIFKRIPGLNLQSTHNY